MWITLWMSLLATTKKETTLQAQPIVTTKWFKSILLKSITYKLTKR